MAVSFKYYNLVDVADREYYGMIKTKLNRHGFREIIKKHQKDLGEFGAVNIDMLFEEVLKQDKTAVLNPFEQTTLYV